MESMMSRISRSRKALAANPEVKLLVWKSILWRQYSTNIVSEEVVLNVWTGLM